MNEKHDYNNNFLSKNPKYCTHAIVAVGVEKLADTTKELLKYGIKNILVEKPILFPSIKVAKNLESLVKKNKVLVYTGYNHRFEPHFIKMK